MYSRSLEETMKPGPGSAWPGLTASGSQGLCAQGGRRNAACHSPRIFMPRGFWSTPPTSRSSRAFLTSSCP